MIFLEAPRSANGPSAAARRFIHASCKPVLRCAEETAVYGTYCYLWGSVAFVVAGVLPLLRPRKVERLRHPPLDAAKSAANYVLV